MKRIIPILIAVILLTGALATTALADGIYGLTITDTDSVLTLIAKTGEGTEVTAESVQIDDTPVNVSSTTKIFFSALI